MELYNDDILEEYKKIEEYDGHCGEKPSLNQKHSSRVGVQGLKTSLLMKELKHIKTTKDMILIEQQSK